MKKQIPISKRFFQWLWGPGRARAANTVVAKSLVQMAEEGDANSQYRLATQYSYAHKWLYNSEYPEDWNEAFKWFKKAADQGHLEAQVMLAQFYLPNCWGVDVELNEEEAEQEAIRILTQAAEKGSVDAKRMLHDCTVPLLDNGQRDAAAELPLLLEEAAADQRHAHTRLAEIYRDGGPGIEASPVESFKWMLIGCYHYSDSNHRESLQVLAKPLLLSELLQAEREAQSYHEEVLVAHLPRDYFLRDMRQEAKDGKPWEQYALARWQEEGWVLPKDEHQAFKFYRKAAEQRHALAMIHLALCYRDGRGVKPDLVQAATWFRLAAGEGFQSGKEGWEELAPSLSPSDGKKVEGQAAKWTNR